VLAHALNRPHERLLNNVACFCLVGEPIVGCVRVQKSRTNYRPCNLSHRNSYCARILCAQDLGRKLVLQDCANVCRIFACCCYTASRSSGHRSHTPWAGCWSSCFLSARGPTPRNCQSHRFVSKSHTSYILISALFF